MGLCMQSGELNRQARRNMVCAAPLFISCPCQNKERTLPNVGGICAQAKAEKRSKNAKPKGGVEAMNEVSCGCEEVKAFATARRASTLP